MRYPKANVITRLNFTIAKYMIMLHVKYPSYIKHVNVLFMTLNSSVPNKEMLL